MTQQEAINQGWKVITRAIDEWMVECELINPFGVTVDKGKAALDPTEATAIMWDWYIEQGFIKPPSSLPSQS